MVIAHELAHAWIGGLVTMRRREDLWLDEALTTYISRTALAEILPGTTPWAASTSATLPDYGYAQDAETVRKLEALVGRNAIIVAADSRALPERRRRRQAALAGHHQHRGQARPRAPGAAPADRQALGPARPARRRPARHGLARSTQRARPSLTRTATLEAAQDNNSKKFTHLSLQARPYKIPGKARKLLREGRVPVRALCGCGGPQCHMPNPKWPVCIGDSPSKSRSACDRSRQRRHWSPSSALAGIG
jgi:hypothetical protein